MGIREVVFVIGAVNRDVTTGAGPGGIGSVGGIDLGVGDCGRRKVALQADGIDVGEV